jgi:hypothetical protein
MATARSSRVVLNRSVVDATRLAVADGAFAVAKRVVQVATSRVPDDPRLKVRTLTAEGKLRWEHEAGTDPQGIGLGLIQGGGALVFVDRKKVDGTLIGGKQIKKPRALKLDARSIVAIAGFGFPGRFVEKGTVDTSAEPFLSPSMDQVAGETPGIMQTTVRPLIAAIR